MDKQGAGEVREPPDQLAERARELLDESVTHLDAATLAALHRARNRALRRATTASGWGDRRYLLPGLGLAAAALLTLILLPEAGRPPGDTSPLVVEDIDLLVATENLEDLDEIEFFDWLSVQADAT